MKELVKQLIKEQEGIPGNEETVKKLKKALSLYDKKDYREISKFTCYGSLAYCCRSTAAKERGKECFWRDLTIDLLGLTKEEYEKLKDEFDEKIKNSMK